MPIIPKGCGSFKIFLPDFMNVLPGIQITQNCCFSCKKTKKVVTIRMIYEKISLPVVKKVYLCPTFLNNAFIN